MEKFDCSKCPFPYAKRICKTPTGMYPNDCTTILFKNTIGEASRQYLNNDIIKFSQEASKQEASCYGSDAKGNAYPLKPRIVEIIEFCKKWTTRR